MKNILLLILTGLFCACCTQSEQNFLETKDAYFGLTPPGLTPEIFAPGIVSDSCWQEHCQLAISPRGDEIYWSRFAEGPEQIYFSKIKNGKWTKPAVACFNKDDTIINGGPVFSPDGDKLFFYSKDRPGGLGYIDAWYVERTDEGWSRPFNMGEPYNSIEDNRPPIITKNNNAYTMPRKFPNENGELLRYKYFNHKFSDPLSVIIYKGFKPWWPIYVSPDENYVIFPARTTDGFGRLDLYISFKANDGKRGLPVNMGEEINTSRSERFPVVSPDGKYMFFMRHTKSWDIFWVSTEIFDELKKQSLEN